MRLWIGLARLKPNPKCKRFRRFDSGKGAYVHIAAWAEPREAFESRVQREAEEIDCILCGIDDVALLRTTATNQPEAAVFGTFHRWMSHDSN